MKYFLILVLSLCSSNIFANNGFEVLERFANGHCVRPTMQGNINAIVADGNAVGDLRIDLINFGIDVDADVEYSTVEWEGIQNIRDRAANYEKCTLSVLETVTSSPGLMDLLVGARIVADRKQNWLFCWHGRSDHEFVIAYPIEYAKLGINLDGQIFQKPWDSGEEDLSNDSLKMCKLGSSWFGGSQNWFPQASYLKMDGNSLEVCEHNPGCKGKKWVMKKSSPPSGRVEELIGTPSGHRTQILGFSPSSNF